MYNIMNVNNSTFKMKDIKFKKVKISDAEFLYKLLSERIPKENISHKKMPSFLQHKKFIKSKPYSYWYIIFLEKNKIGTIYLTNINEIGIHIKKEFQSVKIEKIILKKLFSKHPRTRYLVNINPENKKSIQFFKKNGFKLLQLTYELETGDQI
jgi:RimJ/RimL family protein N-acetyltransferase